MNGKPCFDLRMKIFKIFNNSRLNQNIFWKSRKGYFISVDNTTAKAIRFAGVIKYAKLAWSNA